MRMSYWKTQDGQTIYATHAKLKGFFLWRDYYANWEHCHTNSDSYHSFFQRQEDYSPTSIADARALHSTIKAFKYIEPQQQEAGTQPAIQ